MFEKAVPATRLPPELALILRSSGLPFEVTDGRRHLHIRVAGRLAGVFPKGSSVTFSRSYYSLRANVRRLIKELKP